MPELKKHTGLKSTGCITCQYAKNYVPNLNMHVCRSCYRLSNYMKKIIDKRRDDIKEIEAEAAEIEYELKADYDEETHSFIVPKPKVDRCFDKKEDDGVARSFTTGATRDTAEGKLDYEGFLSPTVLKQYAKYMNMNRLQSDGKLRDSDNWQKGIPMDVYMKSGYRHFFEWWEAHRSDENVREKDAAMVAAMCGLLFNVMGYLHELLKEVPEIDFDGDEPTNEMKERQDALKLNTGS